MLRPTTTLPEMFPVLSRGRHRNPRKGACFMEMASYLAGERWSDHPRCTHPLLAGLARLVNDHTSDEHRNRLAELVPSVIGLTGDDVRLDARIALRSATTALPVVSAERQNVMAVAVVVTNRLLNQLDGRPPERLEPASVEALDQAPIAARWAARFTSDHSISPLTYRRSSAPATVRTAVPGIAQACIPDADALLRDLLVGAIRDCGGRVPGDAAAEGRVPAAGAAVPASHAAPGT